jgi:arylsulfatase A-like enzyme
MPRSVHFSNFPRIVRTGVLIASWFVGHWSFSAQPNVLVIFIDDMGYGDPSCFGNELVTTPNIDRLAAEGRRFTNFYVNSPICSASRVALSTGQYQQRWRIQSFLASRQANQNRRMADFLDPAAIHTAQVFKDAGYRTAHFGKWHMGGGRDVGDAPLPTAYGFDETLVSFEGLGDRVLFENEPAASASAELGRGHIERAPKHDMTRIYVDRAREFTTRDDPRPFYLELFPNDVHDAFAPLAEDAAPFADLTTNPEEQKFLTVLVEMDHQIGRLLDHLDASPHAENTLVIFTSDNGPTDWPRYYKAGIEPPGSTGPFFGRKWSLYEGGIRMPFIIRWPGRIPAQTTDNQTVVAAFDLQPSLIAMTGINAPAHKRYDGRDMSAALFGQPTLRPTPVFWEYGAFGSIVPGKAEHISPTLAMREGNWKFLVNTDGSEAKLFDLSTDLPEQRNLASTHPRLTSTFTEQTLEWWRDVIASYPNL